VDHTWTIVAPPDTSAPTVTITDAPNGQTQNRDASFSFSADESGVAFECKRDDNDWHACESPRTFTDLGLGEHVFRVKGSDAAGNTSEVVDHTWTIVAPPPTCDAGSVVVDVGRDSWVLQSSPGKNYGSAGDMKVNPKSGNVAQALVRFQLPDIPAGCVVTKAELRLFASSYKNNRTLEAVRLAADWQENQVTWQNRPPLDGNVVTTASGKGWRTWDVTPQVRWQYNNENHGFLIRDQKSGDNEQVFRTRENGNNAPRLVVTFGPPG